MSFTKRIQAHYAHAVYDKSQLPKKVVLDVPKDLDIDEEGADALGDE